MNVNTHTYVYNGFICGWRYEENSLTQTKLKSNTKSAMSS